MKQFMLFAGILLAILSLLFYKSFDPVQVPFSNDGPMGSIAADRLQHPEAFYRVWDDLNWIGQGAIAPGPTMTKTLWVLPAFMLEGLLLLTLFCFFKTRYCTYDSLAKATGSVCILLACAIVVCMISQFTVLLWVPQLAGGTFVFSIITLGTLGKI